MKPPKNFDDMDIPEGWSTSTNTFLYTKHNSSATGRFLVCCNQGEYWDYHCGEPGWVPFDAEGCETLEEVVAMALLTKRMQL